MNFDTPTVKASWSVREYGTPVAGILATKENGTEIKRISQEASIVSIKIFSTENAATLSRFIEEI